jgi:L-rhamnose isomerase / sugar isomerase
MPTISEVKQALRQQWVETPSWAYGNTGTRFKVFKNPAAARDAYEKVADAALVHQLTGVAPSVALHIPWDKVDDYGDLAKYASDLGMRIGAINPNVFQEDDYRLGSVCHPDPAVRRKATGHLLECVDIAAEVGSPAVSLWFADGTNYPGQDDIKARQDRLADALRAVYDRLPPGVGMLLEYKLFEPGFYTMDVPDWGTSLVHCLALGDRANVLVDTGHHAPGTNIEFIVASLLRLKRLGGFHFNSRFYADDDLLVGAADPYQLFRIMSEIVAAGAHLPGQGVAFMLDQCHNIEEKVAAELRSVMNVQEATAKALLVDRQALAQAQAAGDVMTANAIYVDAFNTDVRPLLAELRQEMGLDPDPLAAYARSGHLARAKAERAGGSASSWGG